MRFQGCGDFFRYVLPRPLPSQDQGRPLDNSLCYRTLHQCERNFDLEREQLRNEAKLGATHLKVVPRSRSVSIAISSAQNDAGVFELNFRDERYMPFEGAGAISSWELSLPENFKQFDYRTISDVILHISYTAEEDGTFRGAVEKVNGATQGALINILTSRPLAQAYSLRHDFSNELYKLLHSPLKTAVEIEISDIHFPIFLKFLTKYQVNVTNAELILQTSQGQTANNFKFRSMALRRPALLRIRNLAACGPRT